MKKFQIILLSTVSVFILVSAVAAVAEKVEARFPPQVTEMLLETRKSVKTIDMDSFRKIADNPQGVIIVDVRELKAFTDGHVPEAINIPRGVIELEIWKYVGFPDKTNYNKKMYLYCETSARGIMATKRLQDLGFTDVTAVLMKLKDWKKVGYPLVKLNGHSSKK